MLTEINIYVSTEYQKIITTGVSEKKKNIENGVILCAAVITVYVRLSF